MSESYDCIVMGGGPAGATVAALLAERGRKTVVLERSPDERPVLGSSLMPQTYWSFKRLGLLDQMRSSNFIQRSGLVLSSASGAEATPLRFTDRDPNEWSTTWQVRRDEFDKMLLDHAESRGAEVRRGACALDPLFDGDRAIGVRVTQAGETVALRGRVIVDATGQAALLSRRLGLRYPDDCLRNAAIYATYRGGRIEERTDAGATRMILTDDLPGWFWHAPLRASDGLVSVGLVAPASLLLTGRGDDPTRVFDEEAARCPAIRERLDGAERVGAVRLTADFAWLSRRVAGDGWVLVGDAFGYLDPAFDSSVMLAMKGGEFAADAISAALNAGDTSGRRLGVFGPRLAAGMQNIRRLIYAFYDVRFNLDEFIADNPGYVDHLMRILIGDVFNAEVADIQEALRQTAYLPEPIELEQDIMV